MTLPGDIIDLVFWPASVRTYGFKDHVVAAAAGGFSCLAIAPETYAKARSSGLNPRDMKNIASDHGVRLSHLDTLTDWAPVRLPRDITPELKERFDATADQCFQIVESLELTSILAVGGYDKDTVAIPALIDGFGKLCDRAANLGVSVDLEFMPFWGLPDLASAWTIVGGASRENSGILVDTWHFARSASDFDLLRSLPDKYFRGVQVSDARKRPRGATLLDDRSHYCEFPGEGELPIVEILKSINEKGHLRHIGPEVFSDAADRLSPTEAGHKCGASISKVLEASGISYAR